MARSSRRRRAVIGVFAVVAATVVVDGIASAGSVSVLEDGTPAIVVVTTSPASDVTEGGAGGSLTVQLATSPSTDVTVTVTADAQCTVDGNPSAAIAIPAASWDVPVPVTLAAVDDPDLETSPHACALSFVADSPDPLYAGLTGSASVNVTDDDAADEVVTPADDRLVGEARGTDTVSAPAEAIDDVAPEATDLAVAATGGVAINATFLSLHEALSGTTSYSVVLESAPTADVTITLGTADGQTTTGTGALTFTAADWDEPQFVTVAVVDDTLVESSPHPGLITHAVSSADAAYGSGVSVTVNGVMGSTVTVPITDDETTASIAVSPAAPDDQSSTTATASITGGELFPAGTVTFTLDGSDLPAASLFANEAFIDLGTLALGDHSLVATYSGDALHNGSSATTTIHVVGGPVAPVAEPDGLTVAEDSGASAVDVLGNDTDDNGDTLGVEADSWTQGAHGTVTCSTSCTYTPDTDFNGTDAFTYTVTDGALTDEGTVTVTVTPVNDAPAVPGTIDVDVQGGGSVVIDLRKAASDVDGDALSLASHGDPAHGTLTCGADGVCTYTPDAGYSGPDSFRYTVTDGVVVVGVVVGGAVQTAATVTGIVRITVVAAPPATAPGGGGTGGSDDGGTGGTGGSTLPTTGGDVLPMVALAAGLILLGRRLVSASRPRG